MLKISRLNPLIEAVKSSPGRVNKIFIQKDFRRGGIAELVRFARAHNIPCIFAPKTRLDSLDRSHQGAIAFLSPKEFTPLASLLDSARQPFLLLLDGIEDPQNLGAIIRSAAGAGMDGIILPERRSAGLTATVSAVSAGAVEHIPIARVKNLVRTMEDLKKRGVWLVGAEGGSGSAWYEFDYTLPVGIVLGSEGQGLRHLVREKCDKVLSIPLVPGISSLNVASAASVFVFEVIRQRKYRPK